MASGGRVVHHLQYLLPDRRNTVVLTGYQAAGTRGRSLIDGAHEVKIMGRYVPVRAEIVNDEEFSVHADASELVDWVQRLPEPPRDGVHRARRGRRRLGPGSADPPTRPAGPWSCPGSASGSSSTDLH